MILIGSRALMLRAPKLLQRSPVDFDYVCTQSEFAEWLSRNREKVCPTKVYPEGDKMIVEGETNFEFEIVKPGASSELLYQLVNAAPDTMHTPFGSVPTLDMLFLVKTSHRFRKNSPHFWKTLLDWHAMRMVGAKIRPEHEALLKLRERETYNYGHPKLNQSKDAFFSDDGLVYVWDHDTIHQSVAIGHRPAYLEYLKDGEQVQCDKAKFFGAPQSVRINGVVEEACTLAIERSLVPHPGAMTDKQAWMFALSKVLSSITSGWFRLWGWENAPEVLRHYPEHYWTKFQTDVASGLVKPFRQQKLQQDQPKEITA